MYPSTNNVKGNGEGSSILLFSTQRCYRARELGAISIVRLKNEAEIKRHKGAASVSATVKTMHTSPPLLQCFITSLRWNMVHVRKILFIQCLYTRGKPNFYSRYDGCPTPTMSFCIGRICRATSMVVVGLEL